MSSNNTINTQIVTTTVTYKDGEMPPLFGFPEVSNTSSTDNTPIGPLGLAMSDGLTNNPPEPPIYDDARLARRLMNDEIGPDGPTGGWGEVGQRISEHITGTDSKYTLTQGDSATAKWHFIGGNQNSSYKVYINQLENLKKKHK